MSIILCQGYLRNAVYIFGSCLSVSPPDQWYSLTDFIHKNLPHYKEKQR